MSFYTEAKPYDVMSRRLIPYDDVAAYLDTQLQQYHPDVTRVLDLACGTGTLTLALAQHGYTMMGLDISPQMLALARKKTAAAGATVPYMCQDIGHAYDVAPVEAIICFYGGFNFLSSTSALQQAFQQAYETLRPGGLLLFDQFTPARMRQVFNGTQAADFGEFYAITRSTTQGAQQIHHTVTYFMQEENGRYRRAEEQHEINIYPFTQLRRLLDAVGFHILSVDPLYPHVDHKTLRDASLFIAQKPKEDA